MNTIHYNTLKLKSIEKNMRPVNGQVSPSKPYQREADLCSLNPYAINKFALQTPIKPIPIQAMMNDVVVQFHR